MAVVTNSVATGVGGGGGGGGGGGMNGNGDTAPLAWQTVTPSGTNTVHISIDRNLGVNVKLKSPADNTQVVDVPLNMTDGEAMEIDLYGGGASGSWTMWSAGAPAVAGYYFASGGAPIAPGAGAVQQIFVVRDGALYRSVFGGIQTAN